MARLRTNPRHRHCYYPPRLTDNADAEKPAVDALQKGLRDIQDLCDVIAEEFWTKRNQFADAQRVSRQ